MANAMITVPTGTQTGNFTVGIAFTTAVPDFEHDDITITAVSGNGIAGVTYEVMGSGATYNVSFELPEGVAGSLRITITGMVTPQGASSPEAVMANSPVIAYDERHGVSVMFGTVDYRDGGVVVLPVTFGENVIAPSKTIFQISRVSGDSLEGMQYRLVGEDAAYALVFDVPADRSGSFQIAANGDVLKASTGIWDNVVASPVTVSYGTLVPRIVDYDIPENYTVGEKFDVKIDVGTVATGLHANNVQDVFILEGAANLMGTPTPYKWTGTEAPNLQTVLPDDLTDTDWQQLTEPPAGNPTPGSNNFDADGQWHGESGQYFLVRWDPVDDGTIGIFNMTLREGMLRGPIGS